jgi:Tol biopolymer transport system component
MTQDRWEKVKQIHGDALEREPAEREAFIREAAKDDPELLAELLRLLDEDLRHSSLLSQPALADARASSPPERPRFAPSAVLARRFRIVRFIARGGMGEVYEAEDLELDERVALKAIRQRIAPDSDLRAMLKREVQLARRATHPNVCRIFDLVQHDDPDNGATTLLLSMELIEGQTLAEHLRANGPLAFREALPLIEEMAAGLQAVHDAGIIHGDLKPGNVMLGSRRGETAVHAMVMDFGLALPAARPAGTSPSRASEAAAGSANDSAPTITVVPPGWLLRGGTPEYFAPEQTEGAPATTASDVYAFALVVAEMVGVPRPIRTKPQPERMPSRSARILRRCLETDPARRYSRPSEMAGALRRSVDAPSRTLVAAVVVFLTLGVFSAVYLAMRNQEIRGTASRLILAEGVEATVWAPSPDGRSLAMTSWDTGDLALRDMKSQKIRRLTHKPTSWESHPGGAWGARFSPDGRQIAYQWGNDRIDSEIRIIGADGRGELTLYHKANVYPQLVDWAPDSSLILVRLLLLNDYSRHVILLSTKDGSEQPLPESLSAAGDLRFGTDGGSFIFAVRPVPNSGFEIHRRSLSGAESTLVSGPGRNVIIGWSPDRRRLIFSSDRHGQPGIWAVAVSDRGAAGEPQELVPNTAGWLPIGVTRAGTLFYQLDADATDVYTAVLGLAAGRTIVPPQVVMDRFLGTNAIPNWSDDGRQLVFQSRHGPSDTVLMIYEPQTGVRREVRPDLASFSRPQWTAHGAAVMVGGQDKDRFEGQFRVDPQTGRTSLFMSYKALETSVEGVWSADGKVEFNRYGDYRRGIFRLNAETGERRVLYVPPPGVDLNLENLALSPDERFLAFHARNDAAGTGTLMVIPTQGGQARALLTVVRPESFIYGAFTWTPDSRQVLVSRTTQPPSSARPFSEIWVVPADGSSPKKIDFPAMKVASLRLNRDGKTIAFQSGRYKSEIWALQNFL